MCWRGPHAKGLKFPWRDLDQWWCIYIDCISVPIVAWYGLELISRKKKSTVGARECVSSIHYDITCGKGCIAWNASVHICWSLMLWHIVAMTMIWFFLFFVHAYKYILFFPSADGLASIYLIWDMYATIDSWRLHQFINSISDPYMYIPLLYI